MADLSSNSPDRATSVPATTSVPAAPPPRPAACGLGTGFVFCLVRDGGVGLEPARITGAALDAGATGMVLAEGVPGEMVGPLLAWLRTRHAEQLPVLALDARVGALSRGQERRLNARLLSADRDESLAAVEGLRLGLELAQEAGTPRVLLGLGEIPALAEGFARLRRQLLRGELLEAPDLSERFLSARQGQVARLMPTILRALSALLEEAARRGLELLVRNPLRPTEVPAGTELGVLREEFRGAPLQPLLDLSGAHLCSALRCFRLRDTVQAFGGGPLCQLGDACGALGGLVPGRGEVEVEAIARHLPDQAQAYFNPWWGLSLAEVGEGCAAVKRLIRRT